MPTLKLEVKDCSDCPFLKTPRHYTSDSFEMVFDWKCGQQNDLHIATLDWNDKAPDIPSWCPLMRNQDHGRPTC